MADQCLPGCEKSELQSAGTKRKFFKVENDDWSDVSSTATLVDDINASQWSLRTIFRKLFCRSSTSLRLGTCPDCLAKRCIREAEDALKHAITTAVHVENIAFSRGQYFNCRGLCGLLHVYGLQTANAWDEKHIAEQCAILASYSRHESSDVRAFAVSAVFDIAMRCPRLCSYFDKTSLLLSLEKPSEDLDYVITCGERIWLNDEEREILQRHSISSPTDLLSWNSVISLRSTLLPLLLDMLCSQSMYKGRLPFQIFIGFLCDVEELFVYHRLDGPDPVIRFWLSLAANFNAPHTIHGCADMFPQSIAGVLMESLMRTWRSWNINNLGDEKNGQGLTHFIEASSIITRSLGRFLSCMESYRADLYELIHESTGLPYTELRSYYLATSLDIASWEDDETYTSVVIQSKTSRESIYTPDPEPIYQCGIAF